MKLQASAPLPSKACNRKTYLGRKIDSQSTAWQLFTDDYRAFPQAPAPFSTGNWRGFSTGRSTVSPQAVHSLSTACEHRPVVPQDRPRRVVAGRAGDATAGMGAGAAMIKPLDRSTVIGMAQHRPRGKKLVQR